MSHNALFWYSHTHSVNETLIRFWLGSSPKLHYGNVVRCDIWKGKLWHKFLWNYHVYCRFTYYITGEYMYVEASSRKLNDKTRLISPPLTMKGDTCVLFWYHMYGRTVGRLNLYTKVCYSPLFVVLMSHKYAFRIEISKQIEGGKSLSSI